MPSIRRSLCLPMLAVLVLSVRGRTEQVKPPPDANTQAKPQAVTAAAKGYTNVALGKPYTLSPRPTYRYCTDPGDRTQLTDGKRVNGYFWVQKGTVGWKRTSHALITIDLGKVEPIRGVSLRSAAGVAGVGWPTQLSIFVSEDAKTYHAVGDLIELSSEHGLPDPSTYSVHTYWTDELKTKGRFVQIAMVLGSAYGFCDEIEVWRGEDTWLDEPVGGKVVGNVEAHLKTSVATSCVRRRLRMDADAVRKAIEASTMSAGKKVETLKKLDGLVKQIGRVTVDEPDKLRAVVPLNKLHEKILAVNAEVLRARGFRGLVAWHKNRWDPLGVLEAPADPPVESPTLFVRMIRGEYRSAAFNITNAGDKVWKGSMKIRGLPVCQHDVGPVPQYIQTHLVQQVDTKQGIVVADALPAARPSSEGMGLSVKPGMTQQFWLTFHPNDVPPGRHTGGIDIDRVTSIARAPRSLLNEKPITIPLTLLIEPFDFPKHPTLSLGTWDYTNHPPYHRDLTADNIEAAIADAKAHFHDAPWATNGVMPWPKKENLDADGNLKPDTLDYSHFDKWFNDWKDYARRYMVFSNVPTHLAGRPMGTPEFDKLVGQYFKAWEAHLRKLGIQPNQVALLIKDEPHSEAQHEHIIAWAKAIKAATDFFCIWEDPTDKKLGTPAQDRMLELCDAICPNLGIYSRLGKRAEKYYGKFVQGGKRELWFYQCTGPVRLLDPYGYHRLQAWHCWVHGAVGQGFWAYADAGKGNPWCEYLCDGTTYCPAYVAPDGITTSKHWEAVREGIEDYEVLVMLKRRIDELTRAGKSSPVIDRAKTLLVEGPKRVAAYQPIRWHEPRDRSLADKVRLQILDMLLAMKDI